MSTDTAPTETQTFHGGRLIARALKSHNVTHLFTLSGAHIFPIYDGCREEGISIVDVRHEQTAAFAAEGWAKVTRTPGVCAVTAGPGVTNAMSAIASAQQNRTPLLVLGGRAPDHRWGMGSLQEIDHIPFVKPLCLDARTVHDPADMGKAVDAALDRARVEGGPVFLDLPLDKLYDVAEEQTLSFNMNRVSDTLPEGMLELFEAAERPVLMLGTGAYFAGAGGDLAAFATHLKLPVYANGLGRGMVPADHPNFFSRTRGAALRDADLAIVAGVPMDFRLNFGDVFGPDTKIVFATDNRAASYPRQPDYVVALNTLQELGSTSAPAARDEWLKSLRAKEEEKRATDEPLYADDRAPLHPMRVIGELKGMLDRDATVIGDGGDFVSFVGRAIESYEPGTFLDPGPFGCLGCGPGYALAAGLARPGKQVVLLCGDGAFGFAGMDFDTLVRHNVPVVAVMGNNGIWALEKHPMEMLFGYSVAADLQERCRYDKLVEALGGHGEFVETPDQLRPALERAFASGKPALVNVVTDPEVAYPRSTNLA